MGKVPRGNGSGHEPIRESRFASDRAICFDWAPSVFPRRQASKRNLAPPQHPVHLVKLERERVRTPAQGNRHAVVRPADELLVRRCEVVKRGVLPGSDGPTGRERVVLQEEPPDSG